MEEVGSHVIDHGPIPLDPPGQRVSFGQNGEDVRLWRAFEGIEHGFYVEVGGWDPVIDSISRSFYGRGWSGVVVEPVAEYAEEFTRRRPRDRVFPILAGREEGRVAFHVFPGTGLSTTADEHAANHKQLGFEESEVREVAVRPLSSCLEEVGSPTIHFMIIDVEGAESQVLEGLDLRRHRPWVLVIESTLPMSNDVSHAEWEPGLLEMNYSFAAFDGVNRFYVAREHADVAPRVETPPNALDQFEWRHADQLSREVERLTTELQESLTQTAALDGERGALLAYVDALTGDRDGWAHRSQLLEAERDSFATEVEAWRGRARAVEQQLQAVLASRSWRVTAPLRKLTGHHERWDGRRE